MESVSRTYKDFIVYTASMNAQSYQCLDYHRNVFGQAIYFSLSLCLCYPAEITLWMLNQATERSKECLKGIYNTPQGVYTL